MCGEEDVTKADNSEGTAMLCCEVKARHSITFVGISNGFNHNVKVYLMSFFIWESARGPSVHRKADKNKNHMNLGQQMGIVRYLVQHMYTVVDKPILDQIIMQKKLKIV